MNIRFLFAIALVIAVGEPDAAEVPGYIVKAVANPTRSKSDRNADAHRLPAQTIAFAGVEPGMIVGEFIPGYGYFSRILADVVGPKGKIYGIENKNWNNPKFDDLLLSQRQNIYLQSGPFGEFLIPEKLDLFWITQNYHDLHVAEYGRIDIAAFNREVFAALKPGGIYFILDQSGKPGTTEAQISQLHRIDEAQVIREVTAAGFVLVGESDILRHPRDDLTLDIFSPKIRGQTDEFLLKFKKP